MKKRILLIVTSLLLMIPAGMSYAGAGLLANFPTSAKTGDQITYTVETESEGDLEVTVDPASGADLTVDGMTFTVTFSEAGSYSINAAVGEETDSCSITVSESEQEDQSSDSEQSQDENQQTEEKTGADQTQVAQKKDMQKQGSMKKASGGGAVVSGGGASSGSAADSKTAYAGSANNYLSSLSVKGCKLSLDFNKTNDTYFIEADKGTETLTVKAAAEDDDATVVITGADTLSDGRNKIMVSVTAENGDVRVYRIYADIG